MNYFQNETILLTCMFMANNLPIDSKAMWSSNASLSMVDSTPAAGVSYFKSVSQHVLPLHPLLKASRQGTLLQRKVSQKQRADSAQYSSFVLTCRNRTPLCSKWNTFSFFFLHACQECSVESNQLLNHWSHRLHGSCNSSERINDANIRKLS